ncbi:MAG: hypothetical protein IJ737_01450 [Ruminococcus sp.]|nr:hypothetical protein [Ruminococcus sp.]MBR2282966.1 hypothetical protein [Ruminococcus sp.]
MKIRNIMIALACTLALSSCGAAADDTISAVVSDTASDTVSDTPAETTEAAEAAPEETEAAEQALLYDIEEFESYDSMIARFIELNPDGYVYSIPEDSDLKTGLAWLSISNYTISIERPDGITAGVEIDYASSYPSIEDYYKVFASDLVTGDDQLGEPAERYMFEHYGNGSLIMYGVTGEENISFALGSPDAKDSPEGEALLIELYEQLGL